ncbi:LysR family transcriptional regulator [Vibrio salinus]|uniref:LysR family transcriptional regulator n=1 Tax=Vibrio salinus TaxID=2899784 RepID=UPI0035636838
MHVSHRNRIRVIYLKRAFWSLAGERLNLTQPAVSNALKRLRNKLNDPLFVRTTDGMIPTAYSESIAGVVTDSLNNLRDCLSSESIFTDESTRSFRLMLGDYYGAVILPSLTRLLQEQSPNYHW